MLRGLPLAVTLLIAPACITTRNVGITELPLADPKPTPIVCLDDSNGTTGDLTRGTVAGKPAYNVDFGIGSGLTLNERHEIDGMVVYGGDQCVSDGALCDHMVVVETASATYALHRLGLYGKVTPAPPSSRVIVEGVERAGVLRRLRELELDGGTRAAFAGLADMREKAAWARMAAVVAAAGQIGVGAHVRDAELVDAGIKGGLAAAMMRFNEQERPILEKYPRLLLAMKLGYMLCIEGSPPAQ